MVSITVRIPDEIDAAIKAEAKELGLKKSDIVRFALRDRYSDQAQTVRGSVVVIPSQGEEQEQG